MQIISSVFGLLMIITIRRKKDRLSKKILSLWF